MVEKIFTGTKYLSWLQSASILLVIALGVAGLFPEAFKIGFFMIILADLLLIVPTILYYVSGEFTISNTLLSFIIIILIALITWLVVEGFRTGRF